MVANADAKPSLMLRFKKNGREAHSISNSLVNARLVALFTDRKLYGRALGCFYHVHKQLDACLQQNAANKWIKQLEGVLKPMYRTAAYERDLEFYLGPSWREQVPVTPEIQAYLDHLSRLSASRPELLLGHAVTQHMGALAGGVTIRGLARKGMALPPDQGTAAFEFEEDLSELRVRYRQAIDSLGEQLDEPTVLLLMEEQKQAFQLNNAIMASFRMGYLAPVKAAFKLVPRGAWAALLAAVVGLGAAVSVRWGTWSASRS